MKGKEIIALLGILLGCVACAKQAYYIDTYTRKSDQGEYAIRWDVKPGMQGYVEIYASPDPTYFPQHPFLVEQISKEGARYATPSSAYSQIYFLLVFNDSEARVVTSRIIPTQGILNLRDFGGYETSDGQQIRWGYLYRSGDLHRMSELDRYRLSALGIRSQFILSPSRLCSQEKTGLAHLPGLSSFEVPPVHPIDYDALVRSIYQGQLTTEGVRHLQQEALHSIAFDNREQNAQVLHALLDRDNYPILLTDELGTLHTAFLAMLVQEILGLSRADILYDYTLSDDLLPISLIAPEGYMYPAEAQEALTEFFRCDPNLLNNVIREIEAKYGSLAQYLKEELHFDERNVADLRRLLLN